MTTAQFYNEADTRRLLIDPQLARKGWTKGHNYLVEYQITDGKITVKGKKTQRDKPLRADYVLYTDHMSQMLAVIEAKHTFDFLPSL